MMTPMEMLTQRAGLALAHDPLKDPEPVVSPCVSVCRMNADRSYCQGCFRSIDEIRAWSKADREQRLVIWHSLLQRAGMNPVHDGATKA